MKMLRIVLLILLSAELTSAQSYLPLTGGTLTGNLNIGSSSNDLTLSLFKKIGSSGTANYTNVGQHSLPFQIYNTTSGAYNDRKIEIGVLDNGTAVLQANAAGEGYFPIHLNPVAGGVLIGYGNAMTTSYTLQVGGTSYFNSAMAPVYNGTSSSQSSPTYFETGGDNSAIQVQAGSTSGVYSYINLRGNWNGSSTTGGYIGIGTAGTERMRISEAGNIGIGTSNPDATLQIINTPQDANGNSLIIGPINGANLRMGYNTGYSWIQSHGGLPLYINQLGNNSIFNLNGGNVGIGTINPSEKLSVNGNIKSKKIIVTQNGWADYVFNKNYKLKPLAEVETYIKENKHLPEVPTDKEIEKNGVDVGDNQALLLKKIEELTLYMIEQDKKFAQLKEEVVLLKKSNPVHKNQIKTEK